MFSLKQRFRCLSVSACLIFISACSLVSPLSDSLDRDITIKNTPDKDKTYRLTVLHTNDHHGRFWYDRKGRYGMAARLTLVKQIREDVHKAGGHVLLLSGGDINTGVPESDLQHAKPDFLGMNMLGYDAMAVGNHEFDNPRSILNRQQEWADFPFLSANIIDDQTGKTLFPPYTAFNFDGLRIAVMGLTTTDTPKVTRAEHVAGLTFASPITTAAQLIPQLRDKADVIIAVTHMGHYRDGHYGANAPGDVTLARKVEGIDLIVGGHSQVPLFEPDLQNGTYIVQAHEWGKYVGRADFEYTHGTLTLVNYRLIPVNGYNSTTTLAQDEKMLKLLTPFQEQGAWLTKTSVGFLDERLHGERQEVRFHPTSMGVLINAAIMEKTGADFSVITGGAIRTSLEAGNITYKDILMVCPFGDTITTIELTGREIINYLNVVALKPVNSGAFAHFRGIDMIISDGHVSHIQIGGTPLDLGRTYTMATFNYLAQGGDDYPKISDKQSYINTGFTDATVLREYIEKHSPLEAAHYHPSGMIRK